jgi:hypothetical protein
MTIIDRSMEQKRIRINMMREELKALGYSVVSTAWLVALQVQAKRISAEIRNEKTTDPNSHQGQAGRAEILVSPLP